MFLLVIQGLMTPIIKNADQKTISSISAEVLVLRVAVIHCLFLSDFSL